MIPHGSHSTQFESYLIVNTKNGKKKIFKNQYHTYWWLSHVAQTSFQADVEWRLSNERESSVTRHNSADSVPTSNLVCITEVAIRTISCIAGIIYYTYNLITDSQCIRYRDAFNKRF